MPRFRSRDGTAIAYEKRSTSGPAVILVHGSASNGKRWHPILPMIADHFSVYTIDRRGYGNSEDGATYSIEAEFDDILALAETIDAGPVNIVGHSYGALCTLGAAARGGSFRRLVLYEPPL